MLAGGGGQCLTCAEFRRNVGGWGTQFPLLTLQALLTPIREKGGGGVQSSTVSEASLDETSAYHLWRLTKPQCRLLNRVIRLEREL
jgi:hypothetical protein